MKAASNRLQGTMLASRYYVEEYVGLRGACDLYRAYDDVLTREVMVKALNDDHIGDEEAAERLRLEILSFRCEGRAILDSGDERGRMFVVLGEPISAEEAEGRRREWQRRYRDEEREPERSMAPNLALWPCRVDGCKADGTERLWASHYCPGHLLECRLEEFERRRMNGAATKEAWNTIPMPVGISLPLPGRLWSREEWEVIGYGLIPDVMEDHWFLYVDGNTLHAHRSWTGYEVYRARFERSLGRFQIVELKMHGQFYRNQAANDDWHPTDATRVLVELIDEQILLL